MKSLRTFKISRVGKRKSQHKYQYILYAFEEIIQTALHK